MIPRSDAVRELAAMEASRPAPVCREGCGSAVPHAGGMCYGCALAAHLGREATRAAEPSVGREEDGEPDGPEPIPVHPIDPAEFAWTPDGFVARQALREWTAGIGRDDDHNRPEPDPFPPACRYCGQMTIYGCGCSPTRDQTGPFLGVDAAETPEIVAKRSLDDPHAERVLAAPAWPALVAWGLLLAGAVLWFCAALGLVAWVFNGH